MIGELMFNIVFGIVKTLLSALPDFNLDFDTSIVSVFVDYVKMACYLLPMNTIATIVSLIFTIIIVRVVISFIKTIWELLPLV